jgi:type VI secretion system secreted protein VgrG
VRSSGNLPSLGAGMKLAVIGAEPASENGDYACISANHHYVHGAFLSNSASDNSYDGAFMLTRQDVPIAPKRVTAATTVQGPMTAIVVLGGHDAVDEYGRIKVKFHWQSDEENSMFCRVSQMWAGNNWGTVFLPQTGMEVIVEFLNGHIDYPIIMGCVYNAKNMPPWPLPDKNKISGIKTVTENQFSFDDTAGSELIEMIGTKDWKFTIKNNADEDVKANETRVVGGNFEETVTGSITIESKQTITLKVGESKIEISQSGIKLSAMSINLDASLEMKTSGGATAEHKSTGMLTIQGTLVKIN